MKAGNIGWIDLTVPDAEQVRDFYKEVTGWKASAVEMDGYSDFNMIPPDGEDPVVGICHARGSNAGLPAQWIMYVVVDDLDDSIGKCESLGGKVIVPAKSMGSSRYCLIQDPAGAVCALYQPQ